MQMNKTQKFDKINKEKPYSLNSHRNFISMNSPTLELGHYFNSSEI